MKSVARTVCGIELSEDIINLIFAIFDDDDSKDRFHILKGSSDVKSFLFFKSMSERVGSDIERLLYLMTSSSIDFESISKFMIQESLYVESDSFRHWFQK